MYRFKNYDDALQRAKVDNLCIAFCGISPFHYYVAGRAELSSLPVAIMYDFQTPDLTGQEQRRSSHEHDT